MFMGWGSALAQIDYDMFMGESNSIHFFERQNSGAGSMSFSAVTGGSNPFNGLDPGQRAAQRRVFC
jgi:hypothetical protein